jgi:hypothetical protein
MNIEIKSDHTVPEKIQAGIMEAWKQLVKILEPKIKLPVGCQLSWVLMVQHIGDEWNAYSIAKVVTSMYLHYNFGPGGSTNVSVPVIEVSEIMLYPEGRAYWHGTTDLIEGSEALDNLATALNTGKLEYGPDNVHRFVANTFPVIPE